MLGRLHLLSLCFAGLATAGCASSLPPVERAPSRIELAGLGSGGKRLEASFQAAESSCRAEEQRLRQNAQDQASGRQIAEVALALAAGGFAIGSAIYAGLDPSPKGYVIVPLSVGAAAGAVPLGVLLATEPGTAAAVEREQRIRDRRLAVRDAQERLLAATRERERAEEALGALERRLSEQRLGEAQRQLEALAAMVGAAGAAVASARETLAGSEKGPRDAVKRLDEAKAQLDEARGADRAAMATLGAAREAVLEKERSEAAYARQRELDAASALGEALLRLGEVCGQGASR